MNYQAQRIVLAALPLALAAFVAVGLPWSSELLTAASAPTAASASLQRYALCRQRHPAMPARAASAAELSRSQSPQWLREHAAAVERCLRDGNAA